MKKLSVIVPVYNSQDTLVRCLTSLVNQTMEDIEIILINDASTDNSLAIMQQCKEQYPEKVVIVDSKINKKSGGARNQGLEIATGEYIGFVDSDDFASSRMYECLYNKAIEGDYDIVDCAFYSEAKDKSILYADDDLTGNLDDIKRSRLIAIGGYLWSKIYKRELFNDPVIRMREDIKCLEDAEIITYMYLRAKSLGNVKEVLYNYSDIPGSATKTMDLNDYVDSVYGAIESTYEKCHNLPTYSGAKDAVDYSMVNMYSWGINRCLYERIKRNGASKDNVKKYFESITPQEESLIKKLYELRKKVLSDDYDRNKEVQNRVSELDVAIMKECDRYMSEK